MRRGGGTRGRGGFSQSRRGGFKSESRKDRNNRLKSFRRRRQAEAVALKSEEETKYFFSVRKQILSGRVSSNPPRDRAKDLFESSKKTAKVDFKKQSKMPVKRSGPNHKDHPAINKFQEIAKIIESFLYKNIQRMNYVVPTPIQRHAVPLGLHGRDLMCSAQTGSGKTCAFLLPVIQSLCASSSRSDDATMGPVRPRALVLAPTRELAIQIELETRKLIFENPHRLSVTLVYGGAKARPQLAALARSPDIVVATPGRLIDFVDRGVLSLSGVRFLVLDEADRMLDMGFEPQIRRIVEQRDMTSQRQTFMFSATFPEKIQRLARDFMHNKNDYVWIAVGRVGSTVKNISQRLVRVTSSKHDKLKKLVLELKKPESSRVLVFCRTKREARWLKSQLNRNDELRIRVEAIHGDRNQSQQSSMTLHEQQRKRSKKTIPIQMATMK